MIPYAGPQTPAGPPSAPRSARVTAAAALGLLLCSFVALIFPAAGQAGTYTFTPLADTYTRSDSPTTNFGTAGRVSVRAATREQRRTYLRFNVQISAGETVARATLKVHSLTSGSGVSLRDVPSDTWGETSTTWNNAPAHGTAAVATASAFAKAATISLNATPLVSRPELVSMAITTTAGATAAFSAREASSGSPRLVVETTVAAAAVGPAPAPEPVPTPDPTPVPAPADTSAPSAPAGLTASAGNASVTLAWAASSDDVGVTGYRVFRDGALVGSPADPGHTDSGLTNGTGYTYSVKAIDAAGNLSAASATVGATPVAPITSSCPLFGPFDSVTAPGDCWRPYAATSPFNRPVPANPRLYSSTSRSTSSAKIVSRLVGWGSAQTLVAGQTGAADWWHPLYYSRSSDPLYTIRCTQWASSCELEGRQVRIPVGAKPAGGGDGHLAVIDQVTGTEYDMWQAATPSGSGGTLNVSHGGVTQIDGDGLGSNATAAHFGLAAGTIRGAEMQAGVIPHALFSQIKCSGGYALYPAATGTTAAPCTSFGLSNQDAPPMGARLWLDLTGAQIDALPLPAWKKTILKAMHEYGIIVGDTNGGNQAWGIQAESEQSYASFGRASYWRTLGTQVKAGTYAGGYVFDIQNGIDWANHLHVLDPCVSQGTC